jgi:hypothetical protein
MYFYTGTKEILAPINNDSDKFQIKQTICLNDEQRYFQSQCHKCLCNDDSNTVILSTEIKESMAGDDALLNQTNPTVYATKTASISRTRLKRQSERQVAATCASHGNANAQPTMILKVRYAPMK